MTGPKIVVADGRRLFGEALGVALSQHSDYDIVSRHPSWGLDVIDLVVTERAGVALVDYWLDGMQGPPVAAALKRRAPSCRVLLMSSSPSGTEVQAGLDSGARGFVPKSLSLAGIVTAVEEVRAGRYPVCPGLGLEIAVDASRNVQPQGWERWGRLTRREIEVLELLGLHGRRDAVTEALGSNRTTVDNHIERILKKTGTLSQADALHAAREAGVLSPLPPDHGMQRKKPAVKPRVNGRVGAIVLVADPLPLSSEALSAALGSQPGLSVLPERPASAAETIDAVESQRPDVAVLDFWMPGLDGAAGVSEILRAAPRTKVLLLSWLQGLDHIRSAVSSEAVGFLPTSIGISELAEAISLANDGSGLVYAERVAGLVEKISVRHADREVKRDALASLTAREVAVLGWLSRGHSRAQVARELSIAPATVDVHVRNILRKTGAGSSLEAVSMAQGGGVLPV